MLLGVCSGRSGRIKNRVGDILDGEFSVQRLWGHQGGFSSDVSHRGRHFDFQ